MRRFPPLPRASCSAPAGDLCFRVAGIEPIHWSDASPVRTIFRQAFARAGFPCFAPHSFRHRHGHLMQAVCRTHEQRKAWSRNLGHENIGTTPTSYGTIDPHRQGDIIGRISLDATNPDIEVLDEIGALVA